MMFKTFLFTSVALIVFVFSNFAFAIEDSGAFVFGFTGNMVVASKNFSAEYSIEERSVDGHSIRTVSNSFSTHGEDNVENLFSTVDKTIYLKPSHNYDQNNINDGHLEGVINWPHSEIIMSPGDIIDEHKNNAPDSYARQSRLQYADYKHRRGSGVAAYFAWETFLDLSIGVEGGYSNTEYEIRPRPLPYEGIETRVLYAAFRLDKSIRFESGFDILLGAYFGFANIDLTGSVDEAKYFLKGDMNNPILGLRSGFAYNFAHNAALTLNYVLTKLPGLKNKEFPSEQSAGTNLYVVRFPEFCYQTHSIELGFKRFF